jgi:hypothetical protein
MVAERGPTDEYSGFVSFQECKKIIKKNMM